MVKLTQIITNGYVDSSTLESKIKEGWTFVVTLPAKTVHPHAMETDKVTIFSKYEKEEM